MKAGKTLTLVLIVYSFIGVSFNGKIPLERPLVDSTIILPLGGNTWCTRASGDSLYISSDGIKNWKDEKVGFDTYLRLTDTGRLQIQLRARAKSTSQIKITIHGNSRVLTIQPGGYQWYDAGEWRIKDTGYSKIHLSAVSKTGQLISEVSDYRISGSAVNSQTAFVPNNNDQFFYWGRRGPSVHLNYPFTDSIKATWFYNEVVVPQNQDVIGSYFMAIGFTDGYFGIQVNSNTERRILFSIWSPYQTDDPKSIPANMRISLLKKGEGVHTGEFGNEGSGGQSYLRYSWRPNIRYKFLLKGQPDGHDNTVYTAYFFDPLFNQWRLIASFQRPQTNHYLARFHSFLENFLPENGNVTRTVLFQNQWIANQKGQWTELATARFTYDNTARKGYRRDYAGGIVNGSFYLKNCGFFNSNTPYNAVLKRPLTNQPPAIALDQLP